jgi:hypothetical protein
MLPEQAFPFATATGSGLTVTKNLVKQSALPIGPHSRPEISLSVSTQGRNAGTNVAARKPGELLVNIR